MTPRYKLRTLLILLAVLPPLLAGAWIIAQRFRPKYVTPRIILSGEEEWLPLELPK